MPVERSRGSRRTCADGDGLVWTEPLVPPGISLATNLTPGAWDESSQAMPCMIYKFSVEHNLKAERAKSAAFLDAPPSTESKPNRTRHKHKVTPSLSIAPTVQPHPREPHTQTRNPRPPNAFIFFRSAFIRTGEVPADVETSHASLSAIAGLTWAALPALEKAAWHRKAEEERKRHLERFPAYAPASGSSDRDRYVGRGSGKGGLAAVVARPNRRKQREVVPPDCVRQAHIASLLLSKLRGVELREAIAKFDQERRERGEGGVEVRFGPVETPEGRLEESDPAPFEREGSRSFVVRRRCRNEKRRKSEEGKDGRCTLPPPLSPSTPIDPEASTATFAFDSDFDRLSSVPAIAPNTGFASTLELSFDLLSSIRPTANDEFTSTFEWPPLNKSSSSPFFDPSYLFSHAFPDTSTSPDVSSFCRSLEDLSLINPFPQPYSVGTHTGQPSPVLGCSSMFAIGGDPNSLTSSPEWIGLSMDGGLTPCAGLELRPDLAGLGDVRMSSLW
ncbi:HMG box domain-containing protein [Favolaschia claudopus]|uniref:HMG box domain-containing protein n=1 Tax=Favolaschia claudopus TaxID=2862362 RepID=A0AAW0AQI2_9AGAR